MFHSLNRGAKLETVFEFIEKLLKLFPFIPCSALFAYVKPASEMKFKQFSGPSVCQDGVLCFAPIRSLSSACAAISVLSVFLLNLDENFFLL